MIKFNLINFQLFKVVAILFCMLVGISVKSQKIWTLQECVDYSLQHNISLKQQQLNIQTQQINVNQSMYNTLPTLNGMGSYGVNWGKSVDRFTNNFADSKTTSINLYLQTELSIFNGFRNFYNIKKNQVELASQKYNFDYASQMKSLEVVTAYLQILYANENVKNKKDQVKNTEIQLDRMAKLVEAGSVAQGDLLNIKASYAADNGQLIQAENSLRMSYISLLQIMDISADSNIVIEQPNLELTPSFGRLLDPKIIYDYALINRPEIKSAEFKVEASDFGIKIAQSSYYPRLSISAGYGSGYSGANQVIDNFYLRGFQPNGMITSDSNFVYSPDYFYSYKTKSFADQFSDNKNYSLGLNLTIPIFNGLQTNNSVKQSKISKQLSELQLEQQKSDLRKTIEQSYSDASAAANTYKAAQEQVKARQETYNYAKQKFEAGLMNSFDFNQATVNLDIAKSELLNAKYEYVFRVKILDFYFGKSLSL